MLKQQIKSKALEITFDLHNEISHGAANLLFQNTTKRNNKLKNTKFGLLHPSDFTQILKLFLFNVK